jgi:hypothetical protein
LQHRAEAARRAGQAAARAYDLGAGLKLGIHFLAVPFIVLVFRHHLEPWSYYALGALYVLVAGGLLYLDRRARGVRDRALQAAEQAQQDYEQAASRVAPDQPPAPFTQ